MVRSSYRASLGFPTKPALTALPAKLFVGLSDLKAESFFCKLNYPFAGPVFGLN